MKRKRGDRKLIE